MGLPAQVLMGTSKGCARSLGWPARVRRGAAVPALLFPASLGEVLNSSRSSVFSVSPTTPPEADEPRAVLPVLHGRLSELSGRRRLRHPGRPGWGSEAGWERRPGAHPATSALQAGASGTPAGETPHRNLPLRREPEAPGRAPGGLGAAVAAGSQHPFHTADAVTPSCFSEANANRCLFPSSFRASLRHPSSHCAQPAQETKQNYYHTLYQEYVYKGLINY